MFKKVLAATARPLECDESVASANLIAQFNNANLLILYVLESNTSIYRNYVRHYRSGEEIVSNEVYQDQVIEKVYTKYRGDFKPSDKFEFHIAFGVPWMEILKAAREESVDLIILGAHAGKTSSEERQRIGGTIGSTTEGVIKHERCPVMIVNKTISQSKVLFEKIMVSVDFSPSCSSAFKFAVELAQNRESKLYLFHMLPVPPQPEYSQKQYEADILRIRQRLEEEFRKQIPEMIDTDIDTWGGVYPDIEIMNYAQRKDVDLIVMGSHPKIKGKLQESSWYVGNAVERVCGESNCPVVVMTDPKAIKKWEEN